MSMQFFVDARAAFGMVRKARRFPDSLDTGPGVILSKTKNFFFKRFKSSDRVQFLNLALRDAMKHTARIRLYGLAGTAASLVLASSLYGQLFCSHDGGDSWQKVRQEFSEVRALAWMPS